MRICHDFSKDRRLKKTLARANTEHSACESAAVTVALFVPGTPPAKLNTFFHAKSSSTRQKDKLLLKPAS